MNQESRYADAMNWGHLSHKSNGTWADKGQHVYRVRFADTGKCSYMGRHLLSIPRALTLIPSTAGRSTDAIEQADRSERKSVAFLLKQISFLTCLLVLLHQVRKEICCLPSQTVLESSIGISKKLIRNRKPQTLTWILRFGFTSVQSPTGWQRNTHLKN